MSVVNDNYDLFILALEDLHSSRGACNSKGLFHSLGRNSYRIRHCDSTKRILYVELARHCDLHSSLPQRSYNVKVNAVRKRFDLSARDGIRLVRAEGDNRNSAADIIKHNIALWIVGINTRD